MLNKTLFLSLKRYVLIALSVVLTAVADMYMVSWISWFSLIPLFFVLFEHHFKENRRHAFYFGLFLGGMAFNWTVFVAQDYSGSNTFIGVPVFLFLSFYYAIFFVFIVLSFRFLSKKRTFSPLKTSLIYSLLWVFFEWFRMIIPDGIPWIKTSLAQGLAKSTIGIQWLSVSGQWGIVFVIVLVNALLACAILHRQTKYLLYSSSIVLLFYASSLLIYKTNNIQNNASIKISILQENNPPDVRWNEETGDRLARQLFQLNHEAALSSPDLVIWSETAIPWTYQPNEDLILETIKITEASQAEHIIGIFEEGQGDTDKVYNSAALFNTFGQKTASYYKSELLAFLEKPFLRENWKIPFLSNSIYTNLLSGTSSNPLNGKEGSYGILICNENLSPYPARKMTVNGGEVFVNLSNDSWVEGRYLEDLHFYISRFRAVENNRDIVINSNRGISGIIHGNGDIQVKSSSNQAQCVNGKARLRSNQTIYTRFGDWFIYFSVLWLFLLFFPSQFLDFKRK